MGSGAHCLNMNGLWTPAISGALTQQSANPVCCFHKVVFRVEFRHEVCNGSLIAIMYIGKRSPPVRTKGRTLAAWPALPIFPSLIVHAPPCSKYCHSLLCKASMIGSPHEVRTKLPCGVESRTVLPAEKDASHAPGVVTHRYPWAQQKWPGMAKGPNLPAGLELKRSIPSYRLRHALAATQTDSEPPDHDTLLGSRCQSANHLSTMF